MIPASVSELVARALILLIVFPAHELAHAATATLFGDPTPRANGRLTLNPIKHLNWLGSLMFILAGIGWASTPINPAYFGERRRLKQGVVSLSGPLVNLALAAVGAAVFRLLDLAAFRESPVPFLPNPANFLALFVFLNLLLFFFNLIPAAPLDGAQVLGAVIPPQIAPAYETFQRYGFYALIILLFMLPRAGIDLFGLIVQYVVFPLTRWLLPGLG